MTRADFRAHVDAIESSYEFFLAYAAQGIGCSGVCLALGVASALKGRAAAATEVAPAKKAAKMGKAKRARPEAGAPDGAGRRSCCTCQRG